MGTGSDVSFIILSILLTSRSSETKPFLSTGVFLYSLKTSENMLFMFSGGVEKTNGMAWVKRFTVVK